jgi:tetratricopeptide (TPR) repeat protein
VTDVLETSGIVRNIQMPSLSTGRYIKGTQLLDSWVWISDIADHPQSPTHKPERVDRLQEEILLYQRKILENPNDVGTLRTLATAYKDSGDIEKSLEIFDRILKLEPQDALSSVNRGIVLMMMGRHLDAVSSIEHGQSLGNKSDVAFYYLGVAHSNLGHFQDSEHYFTEALKVNPKCRKAQEKLQSIEKSGSANHDNGEITGAPKSQDFQTYLGALLKRAENDRKSFFIIESGDLHRQVGGYPGPNHRMPICCEVMYGMMQQGDQILYAPPKGRGASLKIQYQLPRTGTGTIIRPRTISMDRHPHQPMQNIPGPAGPAERDFSRSAFYCSDLLMVKLNAGDIASAIKYASDLITFSDGEIRDAAKELVDQLEVRMESGLNEIPVELITKADRIAHKVKLGFGTM